MTTRRTTSSVEPIGRFANIEEDVAPTHLLVSDYRTWLS